MDKQEVLSRLEQWLGNLPQDSFVGYAMKVSIFTEAAEHNYSLDTTYVDNASDRKDDEEQ